MNTALAEKFEEQEEFTASSLAKEAMQAHRGNLEKASAALYRQIMDDRGLVGMFLRRACYDACREFSRVERRAILLSSCRDTGDGHGERIKLHAQSLMRFPLPGGMPLQSACKEDLLEAVKFYTQQANRMFSIANWLELIARKVGRGTVGERLTETQLENLKAKVWE